MFPATNSETKITTETHMELIHGEKKFTSTFNPRFSDFDLQGIMNSKAYIDLLAEARFDQMQRCYKYPIENYLKKNQHWVTAKLEFNFESPIFPGRELFVTTSVTSIEGPVAKVTFSFESKSAKGEKIHCWGNANYVLIDLATKTPINISDSDKEIYL